MENHAMDPLNDDQNIGISAANTDPGLSIVVEQRQGQTPPRVFLAHLEHGTTTTIATNAAQPYELAITSTPPQIDNQIAIRTRSLSQEESERLTAALKATSEIVDAGLVVWTPLRTSAAFAANIWEQTFGERLAHRLHGLSTPETLALSIARENARDLGLAQDNVNRLELQLSPQETEKHQDQAQEDDIDEPRERTRRHGPSI